MIIITQKTGQMCNRIVLFAHAIAAARELGVRVVDPAFGDYAHHFKHTRGDWLCRWPERSGVVPATARTRKLGYAINRAAYKLGRPTAVNGTAGRRVVRRVEHKYPEQGTLLLDTAGFGAVVEASRVLFVQGFFARCRNELLARHAGEVRRFFTPVDEHVAAAARCLDAARRRGEVVIGVHVRRADYRDHIGGKYHFDHATYARLMGQAGEALDAATAFVVCSDEPVEADAYAPLNVVPGPGHPVQDMAALSMCDAVIGPPSTFSGWAAFYGRKRLYHVHDPNEPITADRFVEQVRPFDGVID